MVHLNVIGELASNFQWWGLKGNVTCDGTRKGYEILGKRWAQQKKIVQYGDYVAGQEIQTKYSDLYVDIAKESVTESK